MPTTRNDSPSQPPSSRSPWVSALLLAALLTVIAVVPRLGGAARTVPYSEFVSMVQNDRFVRVEVARVDVSGELRNGHARVRAERLPNVDGAKLVELLQQKGVPYSGRMDEGSFWAMAMTWLLPLGLMVGLWWLARRQLGGAASAATRFGRSTARLYDRAGGERVTFADVAGVDEAVEDLTELVDFLDDPERYRKMGAHVPRGVLLVGPPGSGKTLLARAVAGEAEVPFLAITGSEFVEMFVGVGAARVRDLFEQAKQKAPCIIFIDEIDAIGRSRGGVGSFATHDEREQTLNQLLAEMDGFDRSVGIVLMAATNRPEVLDPALLRAGRFDRQVIVDRPDLRGREAILRVHARRAPLAPSVDLALVARRTPGMTGADLANVVNEAALAAARRKSSSVETRDFEEAIDRLQLGTRKRGRVMTDEEKRRIALHEAGHALVALSLPHADPVHRVTIIPRAVGALGATLQVPTDERHLMTEAELRDRLCVLMGGRAAEELLCAEVSTGAENDLERATETARQMVCRFGMSELGPLTYAPAPGLRYLDVPVELGGARPPSEATAQRIDEAVRALVDDERERAERILATRRAALERIAAQLFTVETLERSELVKLANEPEPARASA